MVWMFLQGCVGKSYCRHCECCGPSSLIQYTLSCFDHRCLFLFLFPQPVPEEQQSGEEFGYLVAFRPLGSSTWIKTVLASADVSRYVYKNDSVAPLSRFEATVGVFNSVGEGPFSRIIKVLSAEEGEAFALGTGRIHNEDGDSRRGVDVLLTEAMNNSYVCPPQSLPPLHREYGLIPYLPLRLRCTGNQFLPGPALRTS